VKAWWSIENKIAIGAGLALLILCVVGVVAYRSIVGLIATVSWVTHTHRALETLEGLRGNLVDVESSGRGYVITGADPYLEPYRAAIGEVDQRVQQLRMLTADNPSQQRRLDALEPLVAQRLAAIKELIEVRRSAGFEAAVRLVVLDRGRRLMADIRQVIDEMEREEQALSRQRNADATASARATTAAIVVGSLLACALVAAASVVVRRDIAGRQRAEEALRQAHDELELRVLERTAKLASANQELRQRATRDQLLAEFSYALAETSLDVRAILLLVARRSAEMIGDSCIIRLASEDGVWLSPAAFYDPDPESCAFIRDTLAANPVRVDEPSLSRQVYESGQPLIIPVVQVEQLRATVKLEYWPMLERLGSRSLLIAPLRLQGRSIGLLYLMRRGPDSPPYDNHDLQLAEELANRASLSIATGQLYAQIEQRVVERTVQLQAANKELETFAYSVSHDLRAPLRGIDGFSQALLEDYGDRLDAAGLDYLRRVRTAAQRMAELIDDLLQLSRVTRSELRREMVDLSALAADIATTLRQHEPQRALDVTIADRVVAQGDPRLLRVLLENLLGNAWKFTSQRPHAHIEFGLARHDGKPVYFVRDDGAGFDMAYADKLFGAFQRLHAATEFEGSGIGLATVARIAHRHGGRVWAEGAVDAGATFFFTLN
jgi:CHASE3 domain sensor protein/signal transduction histidine kinase